jgi:hypothetical protein
MAGAAPLEQAARAFPCPRCNAAAGERCLTRYGTNRTYSHPERYDVGARVKGVLLSPPDQRDDTCSLARGDVETLWEAAP